MMGIRIIDDTEESYDDIIVEIDDNSWSISQVYEKPRDTKSLECAICGCAEFNVGVGSYFTAVRCKECLREVCIHDG